MVHDTVIKWEKTQNKIKIVLSEVRKMNAYLKLFNFASCPNNYTPFLTFHLNLTVSHCHLA